MQISNTKIGRGGPGGAGNHPNHDVRGRRSLARVLALAACTASLVLGAACDQVEEPVTSIDCADARRTGSNVSATVTSVSELGDPVPGADETLIAADVLVEGTALHGDNLAIQRLIVAGIPATNDGFNFDRWSVELPFANLVQAAGDDGIATLDVTTVDACGVETDALQFDLAIDPEPGIRVSSLAVAVDYPIETEVLPANGSVPAIVNIVANPEAAGALATVDAAAGQLTGTVPENVGGIEVQRVPLAAAGETQSSATVLYTADPESSARNVQITVTAGSLVRSTNVDIAGAPSIFPAEVDIPAGVAVTVSVETDGLPVTCQATAVDGITVLFNGRNIASRPAQIQPDPQPAELRVSVDADLAEDAEVGITCQDAFGQFAAGSYTGVASTMTSP